MEKPVFVRFYDDYDDPRQLPSQPAKDSLLLPAVVLHAHV